MEPFTESPYPVVLKPGVRQYAWGETEFIPALLGIANPDGQPFAELWMGAHGGLPSRAALADGDVALDALLEEAGERILGRDVAARFGRLPYLFKVLAAARPLSIQVHPSKRQAEEGFARENDAGIPPGAAHRTYRDDNHKPELILAVTEFHALRGFRPLDEIAGIPDEAPELRRCFERFDPSSEGLKELFVSLMSLPRERLDGVLTPLIERLRAENAERPFDEGDRRCWVLRADEEYSRDGHRDRGLFAVYLLNFVRLQPGEAAYLPAGILHAYLRGVGIELMASSDNVLRCGLTPKHIDVPELVKLVRFEGGRLPSTEATPLPGGREWAYRTPAAEFELRRVEVAPDATYRGRAEHSAEILLVLELDASRGVTVISRGPPLRLRRGGVCLIPHGVSYTLEATGPTMLYKAVVPG